MDGLTWLVGSDGIGEVDWMYSPDVKCSATKE